MASRLTGAAVWTCYWKMDNNRPCQCNKARTGNYTKDQCLNCWKWQNSSWWRHWWTTGQPPPPPTVRAPCVHEGAILEFSRCRGEAGHVRDCDLHDRCVRGPHSQSRVQVCFDCPDYTPPPGPPPPPVGTVRHCLYYVCPVVGNGVWQLRLDQLKARADLFNGKKIIAVAEGQEGPRIDPVSVVAAHLGAGWEVVPVANSAARRETVAWEPLWQRLESDFDPGDVAWFGHAKGVTKPVNSGVTVHEWARVAMEVCLDYWPLVKKQLDTHPITGPFKKSGAGFHGSRSAFHYSGTFYWVRLSDFFARDWRSLIDRAWWGTESYPGVAYRQVEAGCLFYPGVVPSLDLYRMKVWKKVAKEYDTWRGKNVQYRSSTGSVTT